MEINSKMLAKTILSSKNWVQVNKVVARKIGFLEAGLLGEIIAIQGKTEEEGNFFKNGADGEWFYITQPYIEKHLGIKRTPFDSAIKKYLKYNLMIQKKKGVPSKNYYLLNWDNIIKLASEPTLPTGCGKPTTKDEEPKEVPKEVPTEQPKEVPIEIEKPLEIQPVENQHPRMLKTTNQGCRFSTPIILSNKTYTKRLNKNPKPLTLSEEIYSLSIPLNIKKILEKNREQILGLNFDICELERFYKKFEWIKENCTKDELEYLDQWDVESIVHHIFSKKIIVTKTTYGLLKETALARLHYKKENALGSTTFSEQNMPFDYDWLNEEHPTS